MLPNGEIFVEECRWPNSPPKNGNGMTLNEEIANGEVEKGTKL
jgi:hypothetical protein